MCIRDRKRSGKWVDEVPEGFDALAALDRGDIDIARIRVSAQQPLSAVGDRIANVRQGPEYFGSAWKSTGYRVRGEIVNVDGGYTDFIFARFSKPPPFYQGSAFTEAYLVDSMRLLRAESRTASMKAILQEGVIERRLADARVRLERLLNPQAAGQVRAATKPRDAPREVTATESVSYTHLTLPTKA